MISEPQKIECSTLFVENLALVRKFYEEVFGLKVVYEDSVSAVLKLENF